MMSPEAFNLAAEACLFVAPALGAVFIKFHSWQKVSNLQTEELGVDGNVSKLYKTPQEDLCVVAPSGSMSSFIVTQGDKDSSANTLFVVDHRGGSSSANRAQVMIGAIPTEVGDDTLRKPVVINGFPTARVIYLGEESSKADLDKFIEVNQLTDVTPPPIDWKKKHKRKKSE